MDMKKSLVPVFIILFASILVMSTGNGFVATGEISAIGEIPATRSVREFITADGHVDLDAVRMAGYEGALDLGGYDVGFDPSSGEPAIRGTHSMAPADNPDDKYWGRGPNYQGIDGTVNALAVYNGTLIVGGNFSVACDTIACSIAAWDGSSWAPLGSGITYEINRCNVYALTVYDGKLIAAGFFAGAGGITANNIAAWDGATWTSLGTGMNSTVRALAVCDGDLVAGGYFTTAGGIAADYIAAWDGAAWDSLGTGMNGTVLALTGYDGDLVAAGFFTDAGGVTANNIAAWDGAAWDSIGTGMNGLVNALAVYDDNLFAGGYFTTAGGIAADYIAAWDGVSWAPLGPGTGGAVNALTIHDNTLIAAGNFTTAGGVSANRVAAWDGDSWVSFGQGSTEAVSAIVSYGGMLVGGGTFQTADGSMANSIAAWDGVSWASLGSGTDGVILAMTLYNGLLVAGGDFRSIDGVRADNIAAWDGGMWTPLGSGVDGTVQSLTVYDDKLIAGGLFLAAGGAPANYIASWNGVSWSSLGAGEVHKPAYPVYELTTYAGSLVAGGAVSYCAEVCSWNGMAWSRIYSLCESNVAYLHIGAMTAYDNRLMVGVNYDWSMYYELIAWDGVEWTVVRSGNFGSVEALAVYNNKLISGGHWYAALQSWDGATWTDIGPDIFDYSMSSTYCIAVYDDKLVVGGYYVDNDSEEINIFALDGSELSYFGSGTNGSVHALADFGKLAAGGGFTTAGGRISASFALWQKPDQTAVMIAGFDAQPVECGVELSWVLYADERIEGYRIYRSRGEDPVETALNERLIGAEKRTYTDGTAVPGERYKYVLVVHLEGGKEVRSFSVEGERTPFVAKLFQNIPNPFNPATSIRYTIPLESIVTIRIYSLSGELVRTLVNRTEPAGVREVTWDGRNDSGAPVSSGIYFCRLGAGKVSLSKKMLLLR